MAKYATYVLIHGSVPAGLALSTVISISKSKNVNQTDSGSYQGISLSSIYGTIFNLIILSRYCVQICTSDLQFGFKPKRSANIYTMLLKEAVVYYINNDSSVLCEMLDDTKAFDRVNYITLFEI